MQRSLVGSEMCIRDRGKDIHECVGSSVAPVARQLLCTGCGLGEGQVALVHAKRSRAPLSTEKHTCFGTISFRSSSGPPLAQMPPRCLSDASQMPLRCLQMLPRFLQMLPPKNCLGSRAGVMFFIVGLSVTHIILIPGAYEMVGASTGLATI